MSKFQPLYLFLEAELPLVKLDQEHEDTIPGIGPLVLGLELGEEVGDDLGEEYPFLLTKVKK